MVAIAALLTLQSSPALAHDYLVGSSPAANATQSVPISKVVLTFNDLVLSFANQQVNQVAITNSAQPNRYFELGCPTLRNDSVTTAVQLGKPGTYTATWRIVSADGHPVTSSISFKYTSLATSSNAGSTKPACELSAQAQQQGAIQTSNSAASNSANDLAKLLPLIYGILAGLVFIGVAIFWITKSSKPSN